MMDETSSTHEKTSATKKLKNGEKMEDREAGEIIALTLRRIMSYIYGAPILDVSRSHTKTQHSG